MGAEYKMTFLSEDSPGNGTVYNDVVSGRVRDGGSAIIRHPWTGESVVGISDTKSLFGGGQTEVSFYGLRDSRGNIRPESEIEPKTLSWKTPSYHNALYRLSVTRT